MKYLIDMKEKKLILSVINHIALFQQYGYVFQEYTYQKYNSDSPDTSTIALQCENSNYDRRIHIAYLAKDSFGTQKHLFWCIISKLSLPSSLSIYFEKYLAKNHGKDALKKMSLNYYDGSFEEKLQQFILFFEHVLNDSFMKDMLTGRAWSDDYYKHLWEEYDR